MTNPTLVSGLVTEMDKLETMKVKEMQEEASSRVIFDRVSPPNANSEAASVSKGLEKEAAKTTQESKVVHTTG